MRFSLLGAFFILLFSFSYITASSARDLLAPDQAAPTSGAVIEDATKLATRAVDYEGKYERSEGVAEISRTNDVNSPMQAYEISISVASASGCTGGMEGGGFLKDGNIDFFSADNESECIVSAHFDPALGRLYLKEGNECNIRHGARCGFAGEYKREKETPANEIGLSTDGVVRNKEEIGEAQQASLKEQARERLIWSTVGLGLLAFAIRFLRRHRKQIIDFLSALPARARLPRKLKISITVYTLWILLLLFTNSFQFEEVFDMSGDDMDKFRLLAALPLVFAGVAYGLYAWTMKPEKVRDTPSTAGTILPPTVIAAPWKPDRKFYMKRTAALLWLMIGMSLAALFISSLIKVLSRDATAYTSFGLLFDSFIFLVPLVFSRPLGFWRKVVCWMIGMAAFIFPVSIIATVLASIVGDIMTLTASAGQQEVSASGLMAGLARFLGGALMIDLLSFCLGLYAVKKTQDYWRHKLSP
jgi:hypothetical protein